MIAVCPTSQSLSKMLADRLAHMIGFHGRFLKGPGFWTRS
jgi:hypothetical protein